MVHYLMWYVYRKEKENFKKRGFGVAVPYPKRGYEKLITAQSESEAELRGNITSPRVEACRQIKMLLAIHNIK